jgi:hypothetical protein
VTQLGQDLVLNRVSLTLGPRLLSASVEMLMVAMARDTLLSRRRREHQQMIVDVVGLGTNS